MSQFAAQQQAGSTAAPRADGAKSPSGEAQSPPRRGTANAFRLLQQRLASTTIVDLIPAAGPSPPPNETAVAEPRPIAPEPAAAEEEAAVNVSFSDRSLPLPLPQSLEEPLQEGLEANELPAPAAPQGPALAFEVDVSAFELAAGAEGDALATEPVLQNVGLEAAPQADPQDVDWWSPEGDPRLARKASPLAASPPPHAQDKTAPLRLLLEPQLPAAEDEFAVAEVDRFFTSASAFAPEAKPPAGLALEQTPPEAARAMGYRFWETVADHPAPGQQHANSPLVPQQAELLQQAEADIPQQTDSPQRAETDIPQRADSPIAPHGAHLPVQAAEPAVEAGEEESGSLGPEAGLDPRRPAEARRRAVLLRKAGGRPSEEAGEVARSLLEIMSLPANATQPQERALAADSLLHLVNRLPLHTLIAMAERLSLMESPPPLILAELIHDSRIEVAGPLLEKCPVINDHDLIEVIADGHMHSNRMIARRRSLTAVLCDALIDTEDASTVLTLVRNPGALISHEAFLRLNELARKYPSLQAPLATRSDLPAPVAFELFWVLPAELRRYVVSRFLTDSSTLHRILKLTKQMESDPQERASHRFSTRDELDRLVELMRAGDSTAAASFLAELLALQNATAFRILSDPEGEPFAVALKALGATRAGFEKIFAGLRAAGDSGFGPRRDPAGLQGLFDSLSFTKARILLTYWDWAVLRTGPYTALTA